MEGIEFHGITMWGLITAVGTTRIMTACIPPIMHVYRCSNSEGMPPHACTVLYNQNSFIGPLHGPSMPNNRT